MTPALLFKQALASRTVLQPLTNALRLVNGAADQFPGITIDAYNRHFLIQQYLAQPVIPLRKIADWIQQQFTPHYLILKNRTLSAKLCMETADIQVDKKGSQTIVSENGLHFQVDLNDAVNPGLFLDMRANRRFVAAHAPGKQILNCFAYTCSFGVYCSQAGATRVVNVDASKKILAWGKHNFALNELAISEQDFVYSDCLKYLKGAPKWNNCFDIIILDPPSFSRFNGQTFSVQKDLNILLGHALKILKPHGSLWVSSNYSGLSCLDLETQIRHVATQQGRSCRSIRHFGQDLDFPQHASMRESHLAAVWAELI